MGMIHKKSRTTGKRPRRTGEKVAPNTGTELLALGLGVVLSLPSKNRQLIAMRDFGAFRGRPFGGFRSPYGATGSPEKGIRSPYGPLQLLDSRSRAWAFNIVTLPGCP